jgi:hypothetical protein
VYTAGVSLNVLKNRTICAFLALLLLLLWLPLMQGNPSWSVGYEVPG